jgi:hypothetical protein
MSPRASAVLQMVSFEELRETAVVTSAGGVTHVANGCSAGVLAHQTVGFAAMIKSKRLIDRTQFAISVDQLIAMRTVGGHPG